MSKKDNWSKWYSVNKEGLLERKKLKRNTPEEKAKISAYNKLYREKYKQRRNERRRVLYATDPNYNIEHRLRTRLQKLLKLAGTGKDLRTHEYLGCTTSEFKIHMESQFVDGMSWDNKGQWHIDHIIPCCSFDLTDESQSKRCFHYTNLRPLWAKDNLEKAKTDIKCKLQL